MMDQLRPYSIERFKFAGPKDKLRFLTGRYPWVFNRSYDHHVKAVELQEWIPKKTFNNYYKFSFVRNPWDWHVSLYHFVLQYKGHHEHELYQSLGSFENYVNWRVNEHPIFLKTFVCDANDQLLVDYVGKFEHLAEDFKHVAKEIGEPQLSLPHLKASKHRDFKSYYTEKTKQLIYDCHQKDIELFNYENIWD